MAGVEYSGQQKAATDPLNDHAETGFRDGSVRSKHGLRMQTWERRAVQPRLTSRLLAVNRVEKGVRDLPGPLESGSKFP